MRPGESRDAFRTFGAVGPGDMYGLGPRREEKAANRRKVQDFTLYCLIERLSGRFSNYLQFRHCFAILVRMRWIFNGAAVRRGFSAAQCLFY